MQTILQQHAEWRRRFERAVRRGLRRVVETQSVAEVDRLESEVSTGLAEARRLISLGRMADVIGAGSIGDG